MFQHLHPKHVCQDCTERLSFENAKPHSAVGPFCLIHRAYVDPCVLHVRGCTTIDYLQFRCLKHIQLHMSLLERSIMKMWNKKVTASNSRSPLALFELGDIASCQPRASNGWVGRLWWPTVDCRRIHQCCQLVEDGRTYR